MLEDAVAFEVVLAHDSRQRVDPALGHRVRLFEFPPREMENLLVSVHMEEIEVVRVLHVPMAKLEGLPAASLVHHDLATFDFWFVTVWDLAEYAPRQSFRTKASEIGPEDSACFLVLRCAK